MRIILLLVFGFVWLVWLYMVCYVGIGFFCLVIYYGWIGRLLLCCSFVCFVVCWWFWLGSDWCIVWCCCNCWWFFCVSSGWCYGCCRLGWSGGMWVDSVWNRLGCGCLVGVVLLFGCWVWFVFGWLGFVVGFCLCSGYWCIGLV